MTPGIATVPSVLHSEARRRRSAGRNTWTTVCRYDALLPERGVAALVDDVPVAVFRTHDGVVHALSNDDPFSAASVLSRGIVGSRGDVATVTSPMHKQVFDLRTGVCLDDPGVAVDVFGIRVRDGDVEVAVT